MTLPMLLLALVGCEVNAIQWEAVSIPDEGNVCLEPQESDVRVTVTADGCLSSSCSRNLGGSCEALVDGTTITVTSEITFERAVAGARLFCTDDCGVAQVTCTIPGGLADGMYDIVIGDETSTVDFPTDGCNFF